VILVATSWSSPQLGSAETGVDKIVHFGMYGVLGFLVTRALVRPRTRVDLLAALAWMTVFAMLDEVHQAWIPGRDASVGDWTADLLGATVGLLVANHLFSTAHERPDLLT
jgi:VanZ family protein